jgi:hypothetical protein
MIKTNELRIGNLVSQNGFFGYVYSIESALPKQEQRFSDKDLVTLFDNGMTTVTIDEINPVPLTAEWLVKFGLNQSNSSENYGSEKICVFNNLRSVNIHYSFYGCDYEFECPRYVHQLQNLYFALTGCELQHVA